MTPWSRRSFLKGAGLGAASLALPPSIWAAGKKRPNIILMMADDVSAREFGCYGNGKHRTPTLDALAQSGVQFKTCWATPLCSPTRAEIMTGRYGFRTGWYHNNMKTGNLAESNETFATLLRKSGYKTAVCGKWQVPGTFEEHGFEEHCMWVAMQHEIEKQGWTFLGPVETKGMLLPGRAARYWHPAIDRNGELLPTTPKDYGPDIFVDFLLDFAKRNKTEPFLVYYPMCLPHTSWDFERNRNAYLPVPEVDTDGNKTGKTVAGSLQSNVEYMDAMVNRIVKGLETLGIRDNTIILFTGDNGTLGYGKNKTEQEKGPRVPMIVNGPGLVQARGAVDTLIDFSDVLPTLCELAGVSVAADYALDGRSFANTLRGEPGEEREWIFSYLADHRFLRDKRWLLDGNNRFYDCGNRRDENGYRLVTNSKDPEVFEARERFSRILKDLPPPHRELHGKARKKAARHGSPSLKR